MQSNRSDGGEAPPRGASPSPSISGRVHGLGESHALRVDLQPVQLPWLADEIDTLSSVIEDELARARARHDQEEAAAGLERSPAAAEAEAEVARREYQLQVLRMIREQIPVRRVVVAAFVASPWSERSSEVSLELAGITAPVTVVGPARGMLVLIRGAAQNVADALGEALRLSHRDVPPRVSGPETMRWPELGRLTAAVANRLADLAAAAQAFTDDYVHAVRQQAYSFDPEHYPPYADELWN